MNNTEYLKKWMQLNEKMIQHGFTWGTLLENDEWNQYMSFDIYKMSKSQWDNISQATKEVGYIFQKTYDYIFNNLEFFAKLGLPLSTWELRNIYSKLFSYFVRMDFIVNNDEIKVIEVNSDTPTGYLETSVCNKIICEEYGFKSYNKLEQNIEYAWKEIIKEYNIDKNEIVYFTSYDWHEEDKMTTQFIQKFCNHKTEYIPLSDLHVANDGIFTPNGKRINYLYRLYPIEYLCNDVDAMGNKIGELFIKHIVDGNIKIINPPSAFIMQSKMIMAIIWEMYENKNSIFSDNDLNIINKYFLPTYYNYDVNKLGKDYVSKPILGREGGGVSITNNGEIVCDDREYYYNQNKIYQKYIEMPNEKVNTWEGEYEGKLLIGSFLINNEPSGLFLRVGEKITGNLSMFKAVTII